MTQYSIATWNINQRSNKGGGNIPNLVIDELEKLSVDIICLTEYVKSSNHVNFCKELDSLGYSVFVDPRNESFKNEILIAVKKKLAKDTRIKVLPLGDLYPNFLHLKTRFDNTTLHIIGVRVQISYIDERKPYHEKLPLKIQDAKERLEQINQVIRYVQNLNGNICLIGDFNNDHYFENQTVDSWKKNMEYLQNYYSYPLLVQSIKNEINLENYSPTGEPDKVYSWINKRLKKDNPKRYIRNDHLFSNVVVSNSTYNWSFFKNPDYKNIIGYPDHAILTATILI
ncbi:endonuclease/exonuclease/phosphatase family protein [Streptococcus parauberis]|uniref:endonuclease/exonuclease/phosphatase family protein n=1 Tax=Streptococcus parauberis TaxID=1348 RepID=UPI000C1C8596|nr:endonuclease/exonuclease/phosphatase family protein [Streptococcus parauberis]PIO78100.1 hypothetical protein ADO05_01903 [Streptococcus parauberis]POS68385.1 hypothetical protein AOS90_00065 [Streptococcus parauberis]